MGLIYKRLMVRGNLTRRKLDVLMDSGASSSVIRAEIARKLGSPGPVAMPLTVEFAAGGGRVTQQISIALRINGHTLETRAYLLEGSTEELILGTDFFQRYKVVLDFEKEALVFTDPRALRFKLARCLDTPPRP